MCGIGSITFDKTVGPSISNRIDSATDALLKALDHRGGDACGILGISAHGELSIQKAPCRAADFSYGRVDLPAGTRAVAIHTRMATQGEAWWNRNNHPVQASSAHVIHNGVIFESFGRTRQQGEPEVDTYALAVAAAGALAAGAGHSPAQLASSICEAMAEEQGSAAVHVAFDGYPTLISARIDGSPLYTASAQGVRITASTTNAVRDAANALGITLATKLETYTPKPNKKEKKRGITPAPVTYSVPVIDLTDEGEALLWNAGAHTELTFKIPATHANRYHAWSAADEAWYQNERRTHDLTTSDQRYAAIAANLLNSGDELCCEMCDTDATVLTPAYGLLCCDDCLRAMDNDPTSVNDDDHQAQPITTHYQQQED